MHGELLGIDVGGKRIGLARINTEAAIAEPLPHIEMSPDAFSGILDHISSQNAIGVVVGLPRGLDGQETAQTLICRDFARKLADLTDKAVYLIDEAGTTKAAEQRQPAYPYASLDSLAATFLLDDFLAFDDKESLRVKAGETD